MFLILVTVLYVLAAFCNGQRPLPRGGVAASVGIPAPYPPGTCKWGACGRQSWWGTCWCDASCKNFNDCCYDYDELCGKCTDKMCDGKNPYANCFCDDLCMIFNDCCPDYKKVCRNTCKGRPCNFNPQEDCQCDFWCWFFDDCCDDKWIYCPWFRSQITAAGGASARPPPDVVAARQSKTQARSRLAAAASASANPAARAQRDAQIRADQTRRTAQPAARPGPATPTRRG